VAVYELEQSKATGELVMDVHYAYMYVEERRLMWASKFENKSAIFQEIH